MDEVMELGMTATTEGVRGAGAGAEEGWGTAARRERARTPYEPGLRPSSIWIWPSLEGREGGWKERWQWLRRWRRREEEKGKGEGLPAQGECIRYRTPAPSPHELTVRRACRACRVSRGCPYWVGSLKFSSRSSRGRGNI